VISEATRFIAQCYGSKKEVMSDVRLELWTKKDVQKTGDIRHFLLLYLVY